MKDSNSYSTPTLPARGRENHVSYGGQGAGRDLIVD